MIKMRTLIVVILATTLPLLGLYLFTPRHPQPAPQSDAGFPIVSKFELPRDYGYFIGDEIPLTLIIETHGGVVLDLVNLPQKGEKHGAFEIRDLAISSTTPDHHDQVYRAAYVLQYFGATPLRAQFEAVEILYALPDDRIDATYTYKSLFTQPVAIHVSRIGPFRPTPAIDLKGPLQVHRATVIWSSYTLGAIAWGLMLGMWLRERRRHVQRQRASMAEIETLTHTTLQRLKQEGAALRPIEVGTIPAVSRLSQILRQYLHDEYKAPAFACTPAELAPQVMDHPFSQELIRLLERCDALKYRPPEQCDTEDRQLWWEAITLFEKLQAEGAS